MSYFKATVKEVDQTGGWTAVASAPTLDRDGEVIDAFAFEPLPDSIPAHAGHDFRPDRLVGRAFPRYDHTGNLVVEGRFANTVLAQEVRQLVRDGVLDSMSVAFHDATRKPDKAGIVHITSGELIAVDFVSVPSNRDARVLASRGISARRDDDALALAKAQLAAVEVSLALLDLDQRGRNKSDAQVRRDAYRALAAAQATLRRTDPRRSR